MPSPSTAWRQPRCPSRLPTSECVEVEEVEEDVEEEQEEDDGPPRFEEDDFDKGTTVEIYDDDEWRRAHIYRRRLSRSKVLANAASML